jgi:glycosyltransferase involved in cell wall biosynthesis
MNIAFIGNYKSIHLQRWVNYFLNKDYNVTILSDFADKQINSPQKKLDYIPLRKKIGHSKISTYLYIKNNCKFVKKKLKEKKIQILHCHYTNFYGWLGTLSGFHPIIQTIWGSDLMIDHGFIQNWFNKQTWKHADLVTIHSEFMRKQIIKKIGNRNNIHLLRWGVDTTLFYPSEPNNGLKTKLQIQNKKIIFGPRSLKTVYNITTIIKAIPSIINKIPNAIFLFCEYNSSPDYYRLIQQLSSDLKVQSYIKFIPTIQHHEMPNYYHISDIVISLALSEGFPISVLESMACGVPTIVGSLPHFNEIKNLGCCYFINKLSDDNELADAIVKIITDNHLSGQLKTNGVSVAEKWNFDSAMEEFEKIYHSFSPTKSVQNML